MTERENALIAINHGTPRWVPNFYDAYFPMGCSLLNNQGVRGKGGRDMFGVEWLVTADTGYEAIASPYEHVLDDITKWKDVITFPDLDEMDWAGAAKNDLKYYNKEERLLALFGMEGNFNRLESLMGIENALISMYTEPDAVAEFFDAHTEFKVKTVEKMAQYYKPDIYVNGDDVATSDGLLFEPDIYRKLIQPFEKRLAQTAISHGIMVEHHVCGKVDDIIPDIIDTGATIWQTAQIMNDLLDIKEKYGDKLCIHGGWNSTGECCMEDATEEQVRAEVRRCVDTYAPGGNYMLFAIIIGDPANPKTDQMKLWCRDECRKYSEEFYGKL